MSSHASEYNSEYGTDGGSYSEAGAYSGDESRGEYSAEGSAYSGGGSAYSGGQYSGEYSDSGEYSEAGSYASYGSAQSAAARPSNFDSVGIRGIRAQSKKIREAALFNVKLERGAEDVVYYKAIKPISEEVATLDSRAIPVLYLVHCRLMPQHRGVLSGGRVAPQETVRPRRASHQKPGHDEQADGGGGPRARPCGWSFEEDPEGSRRRDCHFTDIPSPSLLKHLLKGEGGAAE